MSELHIVFGVGEVDYVIPADEVVVLDAFDGATPVPGTPPWVTGLVQIRGDVMPLVDLRTRFGLPPLDADTETRVVVVRESGRTVGLLVERAREVVELAPGQLQPPPPGLSSDAGAFVRAVAQMDGRLLVQIDSGRVIGEEHRQDAQQQRTV